MINFLITQVSTMESALKSSQSISQSNVDLDRQNIIRIKSDLKAQGDNQVQSLGTVAAKLHELEMAYKREESLRADLAQKLRRSEEQSGELANFIRSLSTQSESELN